MRPSPEVGSAYLGIRRMSTRGGVAERRGAHERRSAPAGARGRRACQAPARGLRASLARMTFRRRLGVARFALLAALLVRAARPGRADDPPPEPPPAAPLTGPVTDPDGSATGWMADAWAALAA